VTFNISAWKSQVEGTFVLNNKYAVLITPTTGGTSSLQGMFGAFTSGVVDPPSYSTVIQGLSYRCVQAVLPGQAIRTTEANMHGLGVREKMPFAAAYTDAPLTFYADSKGDATHVFWKTWMEYVATSVGNVNVRTAYTIEYKDNFSSTIQVNEYDADGRVIQKHYLFEAFPIALNDAPVSWMEQNSLLTYTVTIAYTNWGFTNGADGSGD